MKRLKQGNHSITGVFVYCLMGVFALAGTLVAILGAKMYRTVSANAQADVQARIPAAYVRTLARSADAACSVTVQKAEGMELLVLSEYYDDEEYLTRVYTYGGELCTCTTGAEEPFQPEDGDSVCALSEFHPYRDGNLLKMELVYADGEKDTVSVYLPAAMQ